MKKAFCLTAILFAGASAAIFSQTFVSVPLDSAVYQILDLAEERGLCSPLPNSKPYTRARVLVALNEILAADAGGRGALNDHERLIIEAEQEKYAEHESGFDINRGAYYAKTNILNTDYKFTATIGVDLETSFSQSVNVIDPEYNWGFDLWAHAYFSGDVGNHFSYDAHGFGGLLQSPRRQIGEYHTYYPGYEPTEDNNPDNSSYVDRIVPTYSQPLAYFPYSYKKRWDGSVFYLTQLDASGFQTWPKELSGAYALRSELTASYLENKLILRLGRFSREWGAMAPGSSLILNSNARPFLGLEAQFQPTKWFNISTMISELEYYNDEGGGIKKSAATFQNMHSITMLEFNYKNILHIDFGDAVVWPKRLEMGYIDPFTNNFFYQNNIGDFDNLMIFFNIKGKIKNIMSLWFSFYDDEAELQEGMHLLDRSMIAVQGGATINIPALPFSFIRLSYTKIEPYTYTHNRIYVPWYNESNGPMETGYVNNGVGIGYYLPPNSDEFLVRFETMFARVSKAHVQYQLIRHGADYGESAVDGSSYLSELDPYGRDDKAILRKFFLHDGAYQWLHIIKTGAEHRLKNLPLSIYGEAGIVFSYFTNIAGEPNQGEPSSYEIIDTAQYPHATNVVVGFGIKVFP
jgi:hypothetical protein